ncbi:putative TIM-barrel fold metal-dependent hydrolase [Agrobacterium vitis]|nr:putative TIM-barrel fold metal-dependent hydrolase [Agrobacterium vitis]MBE1440349.1 putative TIM-barrel fold metal-dependent hydrolase [Agrobacterium vitis]
MIVTDAQIHLWTGDAAPPHHWRAPFLIDDALREMDAAGIDRAVNCPANWDPDSNDYAVKAARLHPDRFVTMGWFPLDTDANEDMVEHWMEKPGMIGLRFVLAMPEIWPRVVRGEFDWLFQAAARRAIPFGLMAPPKHVSHLSIIADAHPDLRILIDHMGVSPFDKLPSAAEHLTELVALARYPNISIKATAVPSMSNQAYPFADTFASVKSVYEAFGPRRLFWGSDITRLRCSWRDSMTMFTEKLDWLKDADRDLVMGGAITEWLDWPAIPAKEAR